MKTVLTAAAIATLTLAAAPVPTANASSAIPPYEAGQRETRHQREERLRQAQRRASPTRRVARHQREEQWRDPG
ncbi:MAG: hypothetical protein WAT67_12705 [Candidatus Contendobacter sp.]